MKHIVVSIYDEKLSAFMRPWYTPTTGAAIRSFTDEVNRNAQDNAMRAHADDYRLYQLASFDEENGKFTNLDVPQLLASGAQVKI